MNVSRLFLFGLALSPAVMLGQKREDFLQIQRDVAQLQEQVKQLQRSQDEKMAALQSLVQQSVDASAKVSSGLGALAGEVGAKLNDQQSKLVAPVATLGTKVDQNSDDLRSLSANMAELVRRFSKLESSLTDLSSAVRTLSAPPAAPPPTAATAVPGPPAGVTEETSYQNAWRDYQGGKAELALQEFSDYLKYFSDRANAPSAQYYIGYIYFNAAMYEDAAKAFDAVLERFPENPKTAEALYYKAVSLMKGEHRTEAGDVFKEFIDRYPRNEHVSQAHANLRALGLERSGAAKKRR